MSYSWEIVDEAISRPISFEQVRNHLRLFDFSEKSYIEQTIDDATTSAETAMQCSLVARTLAVTHWDIAAPTLYLPRGPVHSITSVTADGITVSSSIYELRRYGNTDVIYFFNSPGTAPIVVTYIAGYYFEGDEYQDGYGSIPNDIRRALLMHVGALYENREATAERPIHEIPFGSQGVYAQYKRTSPAA